MGPSGLKLRCEQGWLSSVPEALEKNLFTCLFLILETGSSSCLAGIFLILSYASLFYFKGTCHYIGPTQIIQDNHPVLK